MLPFLYNWSMMMMTTENAIDALNKMIVEAKSDH